MCSENSLKAVSVHGNLEEHMEEGMDVEQPKCLE